ncbi:uncharacterized protein LOC107274363 [Cephus cinctus]|uniref:Uncharacterized protein LOC107274363 n=1 Tax=Cephus cinctus TaxID=211228 RepID=A0AAJ7FUG8_CEPCN|nr:uncharacterized protein LOC107274363 [Cephus cinctus]XP_015608903.1 uncharacterized protein LOC107274363 [Cephus cinctus]XP_015608904.1 uncharacterized protein LOC107274363 [Cephus cinctus]
MSADNHDQSKPPLSKPPKIVHSVDGSAFDGRKIKRERSDVCGENGGPSDGSGTGTDGGGCPEIRLQQQKQHPPGQVQQHQQNQQKASGGNMPARIPNGFHAGELLQDILTTRITAVAHAPASKHEKIRLMIEDTISEDSKCRVQEIFLQIEQLKLEEKLLLYLKLPMSMTNAGGTIDPLRQPLNPLGNRYEIHQTIMWIRTHLEEDPDVSLPKQEVYDEYNMFCIRNSMKPVSTADFGKIMKQVYPRVRPRRLGTRGNSRYCYAGMRKRVKLDPPTLPAVTGAQLNEDMEENITEEMLGAASTLIREWAETLLGLKFPSLCALARHLVDNLCVDTRSLAAVCILYASGETQVTSNKEMTAGPTINLPSTGKLQLQRKLQQREHIRDQKHRHLDTVLQNQNKEKTVDNNKGVGGSKGSKTNKTSQSPQGTNASTGHNAPTKLINLPAIVSSRHKKVLKSTNNAPCNIVSLQSNCDNLVLQSIEDVQSNRKSKVVTSCCAISPKEVKSKNSRKRANANVPTQSLESSPDKQPRIAAADSQSFVNVMEQSNESLPRLSSIQRPGKISVIPASDLKQAMKCKSNEGAAIERLSKNCDIKTYPYYSENNTKSNGCPADLFDGRTSMNTEVTPRLSTGPLATDTSTGPSTGSSTGSSTESSTEPSTNSSVDQMRLLQNNTILIDRNDKLCTIDPDALDDYLNGGNNSQEQEEELVQYFQQNSSSSSDAEANNLAADNEQISRSDKVSQLRKMLQQNLKAGTATHPPEDILLAMNVKIEKPTEKREISQKHGLILPTLLNHPNQANTRRRVSFEMNVVEHIQDSSNISIGNTVPQSPNTRRRIFNFTPISPGPHSPINGRVSKPNSANASPFVSPRNTPVPRSRSNIQASGSRSRTSQKCLSRSISCNMPYSSRNDTFVVPTSGPELTRQMSAPQSPLTCTSYIKTTEVQPTLNTPHQNIGISPKQERVSEHTAALLHSDIAPQMQLLINYPSHENLQEIKNIYQKNNQPTDPEISELFNDGKTFSTELLYYRSQSVPLHRMVNPTLMSPLSTTQHYVTALQSQSFNPSTNSSVAATPVPSEFNDFGPIGGAPDNNTFLLEDVDPNLISANQQFLIGDKEISPENITNILNILNEETPQSLQILPENSNEETLLEPNAIILEELPTSNLNLADGNILDPTAVLDPSMSSTLHRIIHSRSYPNTPLPLPLTTYTPATYTEDSNGSRSYPSTPLHTVPPRETYTESNEPMLSSPTLNSLNLHGDSNNVNSTSSSVCRNVTELLEPSFLADADAANQDDLVPLGNFDSLPDVDSLTPLFNEVAEPNC